MPGLRLNAPQVQRLCGVDEAMCRTVLNALVEMKFLRLNPDGTYDRLTNEPRGQLRSAQADLRPRRIREAS